MKSFSEIFGNERKLNKVQEKRETQEGKKGGNPEMVGASAQEKTEILMEKLTQGLSELPSKKIKKISKEEDKGKNAEKKRKKIEEENPTENSEIEIRGENKVEKEEIGLEVEREFSAERKNKAKKKDNKKEKRDDSTKIENEDKAEGEEFKEVEISKKLEDPKLNAIMAQMGFKKYKSSEGDVGKGDIIDKPKEKKKKNGQKRKEC